jgi:hypothetical protein
MTAGPPAPASPARARRGGPLQFEDLALFAYLSFAEPAITRALAGLTGAADPWSLEPGTAGAGTAAVALFAAALGAALCLATRSLGDDARGPPPLNTLEGYARFPAMVLVAIFVSEGLEALGRPTSENLLFGVVILLSPTYMLYARLPRAPVLVRRLLMTPAILLGTTAFTRFTAGLLPDRADLAVLRDPSDPVFGVALFITTLVVAGVLAHYVLFVVAPRKVAGAAGGALWWGLRFAMFVAGLVVNVTVPV